MKRLSAYIFILASVAIMLATNMSAEAGSKASGAPMNAANSGTRNQQSTNTTREAGSGQATGKRMHKPVWIRK
jgi:hypothetical protein